MLISEKTLKETCGYFVDQYRRAAKSDDGNHVYIESRHKLSGLSILLVGHREHKHVQDAIKQLDSLKTKIQMAA